MECLSVNTTSTSWRSVYRLLFGLFRKVRFIPGLIDDDYHFTIHVGFCKPRVEGNLFF